MSFSKLFGASVLLVLLASGSLADATTSQAHIKLTDGVWAANNPNDSEWVIFNRDSTQLPVPLPAAPNIGLGYFGTGEFRNTSNLAVETSIEALLRDAGANSYRHTVYWQLFAEPNQTGGPYWNWNWYESHTDGQRIRRAITNSMMLNLVVHKVPSWANKSRPIEHPPLQTVIEEQVTLNDTAPTSLSHRLILGEKMEAYDKVNVVLSNHTTATVDTENIGAGSNAAWKEMYLSHAAIVPGSQKIFVNSEQWSEVEFFRGSSTLDKKAYVFFPNTGKIRFGDGWNGPILPPGAVVTASYSYYVNPFREYSGATYSPSEQLDYHIDYANGTISRTANSTIPNNSVVKVTYNYLETAWWQRFWSELVSHYNSQVIYFEVWNEENLVQSWPGTEDQYVELLKTAYQSIKSTNANASVVLGGLGFGADYLQRLYARGIKAYFDVLAWHPYGWEVGADNPNSHFNVLNDGITAVVAANNDSQKQVFLNEIGYTTAQQGGLNWPDQGIALSRTLMKLKRSVAVSNISWWGPVDMAKIGEQESDKYFYHLGLMAYTQSNQLQQKPAYYAFKNIATNKGILLDLASYSASGSLQQGQYTINKIVFSSYGNDLASVSVSQSLTNSNDWQSLVATLSVQASDRNTFEYTVSFPQVTTRFVQLQFVKKPNVNSVLIDEILVLSTAGQNVGLNRHYSVEGVAASAAGLSPNLCGNSSPDPEETCQNCPSDVICITACTGLGQMLCNGQCLSPACSADLVCADTNAFTIDSCSNPGTCDAICSHVGIASDGSVCGNGIIESTEQCDLVAISSTCSNLGYSGGTLGCKSNCTFNTANCTSAGGNNNPDGTPGGGGNPPGGGGTSGNGSLQPPCTVNNSTNCKALVILLSGIILEGSDFTVVITDESGNSVWNASVTYGEITKQSAKDGTATFQAQSGISLLKASKEGYRDDNVRIEPVKESSPEAIASRSNRSNETIVISAPQTVLENELFTVTVTDENGKRLFGVAVSYGSQLQTSDVNGTVQFTAEKNVNSIQANRNNSQASALLAVSELKNNFVEQVLYYALGAFLLVLLAMTFLPDST